MILVDFCLPKYPYTHVPEKHEVPGGGEVMTPARSLFWKPGCVAWAPALTLLLSHRLFPGPVCSSGDRTLVLPRQTAGDWLRQVCGLAPSYLPWAPHPERGG